VVVLGWLNPVCSLYLCLHINTPSFRRALKRPSPGPGAGRAGGLFIVIVVLGCFLVVIYVYIYTVHAHAPVLLWLCFFVFVSVICTLFELEGRTDVEGHVLLSKKYAYTAYMQGKQEIMIIKSKII